MSTIDKMQQSTWATAVSAENFVLDGRLEFIKRQVGRCKHGVVAIIVKLQRV